MAIHSASRVTEKPNLGSVGVGSDWQTLAARGSKIKASRPYSLSCYTLAGDNLVRFIYLDESGISAKERVTVVAAIIVNADKELKAVQEHIDTIISDYVPEKYQEGFSFHAKDLFHGSGRTPFDRRHFPLDWARTALKRLLLVPGTFGLPIIYGFAEKPSVYQTFKNADPHRAAPFITLIPTHSVSSEQKSICVK